jgi:2-polyprenyl-3-methyl-5-hydroxy-6-metoxy-1,4-benzoquinol methylase
MTSSSEYFDSRAAAFDALYDTEHGPRSWVYRPLRRRLHWTLEECVDAAGKRVLDIGCGSGRYAVALAELGAEVTAVDISAPMLRLATQRAERYGVAERCSFIKASLDEVPCARRWDVVLSIGLLDYLADPVPHVASLVARSRDRVIVSYPPRLEWRSLVRGVQYCVRPGVSFHAHSGGSIRSAFERCGARMLREEHGWVVAQRTL